MRIEQLTFTRFIAAFAILLFHFAKEDVALFSIPLINDLVHKSSIAVSFFFILSGFVMGLSYYAKGKISYKSYYIKRFARIYPVYFLATLLFVLEWILIKGNINSTDVAISFLMIQSWIPGKELILNTPAWSLGVELFFYLLFPFVFNNFFIKYSYKFVLFAILFFFVSTQIALHLLLDFPISKDFIHYNPIMHISSFFIGYLGGVYVFKNNSNCKNNDFRIILLTIFLIAFVYFNDYLFMHNGLLAVLIVPLLILLSLNNGIITKLFKQPSLVLLGEISYGFYILQFPVFIALRNVLRSISGFNETSIFIICSFFLLFVSYLVYVYYEKPLQISIKKL